MTQSEKVRWGILGPGNIARAFAEGVARSRTGVLTAIATRNPDRPNLSADWPGITIHAGYDALLADPQVDAIYIATPHPFHAEWAIKAAERGKHVLCEKPMALTAFEADAMFHAARRAGTFMGEAFMYRLHPQTRLLVKLIGEGIIGTVRLVRSSFGFAMPEFVPNHRLYANDLAGGGILDVGCYPVSIARLIAGAQDQKDFLDPETVSGTAHLGRTGVDEWAAAVLRFPNDIIAQISCSISLAQDNVLAIFGTGGRIEVKEFWLGSGREGGTGTIDVYDLDGGHRAIAVEEPGWLYSFEADAAGEAILDGASEFAAPGMSWADTLGNLAVLDKWRKDAGLVYEIETPALRTRTLKGEPLAHKAETIARRLIPGLERPISQIALGFEDFTDFSSAAILLDAFFEAGGNAFDTAFIYGGGVTETLLGQWQASRGVREGIVIIGKGAHSPLTYPDQIAKQLDITLERLGTDHVDVYFMHRDNIEVPVGEFVDAMDAECAKGRIRGPFGGSNWTRARFEAALEYAARTGRTAPKALSNNFSLAEMNDPIWEGCVAASDAQWRYWLTANTITNFAWSSQGRGFFTDRAGPGKTGDPELVRVWYGEDNFARRERAVALAEELGKAPIHIALAYCLHQSFPLVPLIGPRTLAELDDSLKAFEIVLSPGDVRWLATGER